MDKEGSMDLSGAFAKLLENPEALKSALGIASALKDSGALEGLSKATGEEYKGGESAYNEENSHEKTQRARKKQALHCMRFLCRQQKIKKFMNTIQQV